MYRNQTAEGMLSYCQCSHTAVCVRVRVCLCVCLRGCDLMLLSSASDMEINESFLSVPPSVSLAYCCLSVLLLLSFHPSPFSSFPLAHYCFSVAYISV